MKPVHKLYKAIMCLNPATLLSSAAKEKCIANLSELPSLNIRGGKSKRRASVLVPICVDRGEVCILYTLRSTNLTSHSGQVAFPGGKIDENETVFDAALRETEEEIGVPAKDIEIWAKMSEVQGRDANMVITPIVGEIKDFDMGKLKPNVDEVADTFTIPMKVFCDPENHGCFMFNNICIPVFNGGKHRVWGITGNSFKLPLLDKLAQRGTELVLNVEWVLCNHSELNLKRDFTTETNSQFMTGQSCA